MRGFNEEEGSSLPPAGNQAAIFRHPPQRAVPSRNALPTNGPSCAARNARETEPPEGLRPWRAQGVSPVFRASLVQTGLRRPPLRSEWERPLSLHLPPLLAWARAKACLATNTAQPFKNGETTP